MISIPHYGGPLGHAVQTYTADFTLEQFEGKADYVCFRGADYLAKVYVNDICVGIHEGFFSPFEFEITSAARTGKNSLRIELENDFIYRGNTVAGEVGNSQGLSLIEGDKLYAATGIGYDDPEVGWHHCPPAMGLYGEVSVEVRSTLNITDIYVRPLVEESAAEVWLELENTQRVAKKVALSLSLYGRNFSQTLFENRIYEPVSNGKELLASYGKNVYKFRVVIPNARIWDLQTPWLYELQATVMAEGMEQGRKSATFGMRSFAQDVSSEIKGMFYLNGRKIRLRGANTMGFEQLDVLKENYDQLIDDILLAKICNMNYWRLTQRPVQDEVYQYCDMLGLMTQTDLPLFSVMRRSKFCEGGAAG